MMRLVDDDEIELPLGEPLRLLAATGGRDRGDDAILRPERVRLVAQKRVVGDGEVEAEFCRELLLPLPDEGGRREH